ncbi:MAG: hypothetical protein JSR89_00475 [Proteobacteria bacterium]|nr:hypothetical protein [Pseudomonadota bacterium]
MTDILDEHILRDRCCARIFARRSVLLGGIKQRIDFHVFDRAKLLGFGKVRGVERPLEEALSNFREEVQERAAIVVLNVAALLQMESFSH